MEKEQELIDALEALTLAHREVIDAKLWEKKCQERVDAEKKALGITSHSFHISQETQEWIERGEFNNLMAETNF